METVTDAARSAAAMLSEAGITVYKSLTLTTAPLNATFSRIKAPSLPRSSHTVTVVGRKAYIFGGEIQPREPVDNAMHVISLNSASPDEAYTSITARPERAEGEVPMARVGHTASAVGNNIYVFGGRGGKEMKALDEGGRVWIFNTEANTWSHVVPQSGAPFPAPRSYHASAASPYPPPVPTSSDTTSSSNSPNASTETSYGTLIIHAGCLSSGGRTSDVWAFDISSRSWSPLPEAPGPARGGTSLTLVRDRLYRFGGFDGTKELGGEIDYLDLNIADEFNDKAGVGIMALSPRGAAGWRKNVFRPDAPAPSNRSVLGLVPVSVGLGRQYLLMVCGEGEASKIGHDGVGRFFDDVWSFQLKSEGSTVSSVKDATLEVLMGKDTGESSVAEVKYFAGEQGQTPERQPAQESQIKPMGRRGWFAVSAMEEENCALLWGGVGEDNERLGDGFVIRLEL